MIATEKDLIYALLTTWRSMAKAAFLLMLGSEGGLGWPAWSFLNEEFVDMYN